MNNPAVLVLRGIFSNPVSSGNILSNGWFEILAVEREAT